MSSTSWEKIFTTIRNLFHTFMFYILKFTYLYHSRAFFLIIIFYGFRKLTKTSKWNVEKKLCCLTLVRLRKIRSLCQDARLKWSFLYSLCMCVEWWCVDSKTCKKLKYIYHWSNFGLRGNFGLTTCFNLHSRVTLTVFSAITFLLVSNEKRASWLHCYVVGIDMRYRI